MDTDAMVRWIPSHGFTGGVRQLIARAGGSYRMSFTNLATGHNYKFCGEYPEKIGSAHNHV